MNETDRTKRYGNRKQLSKRNKWRSLETLWKSRFKKKHKLSWEDKCRKDTILSQLKTMTLIVAYNNPGWDKTNSKKVFRSRLERSKNKKDKKDKDNNRIRKLNLPYCSWLKKEPNRCLLSKTNEGLNTKSKSRGWQRLMKRKRWPNICRLNRTEFKPLSIGNLSKNSTNKTSRPDSSV